MKKTITIGSALLLVSLILSISYVLFYKKEVDAVHPMTENQVRLNSAAQLYKTWNETITIGAIGDILIHSVVYNSALTNNGYDFHSIIAPVQNLLLQPDILCQSRINYRW